MQHIDKWFIKLTRNDNKEGLFLSPDKIIGLSGWSGDTTIYLESGQSITVEENIQTIDKKINKILNA
jgi:uncharacterized protein YlzI (FlbEa/FlbD family)